MADVWTRKEQSIYATHVLALLRPGIAAQVHDADRNKPGEMRNWDAASRTLLIEEGRRQVDRQHADLERVRLRSQVTLGIALILAGTAGSLYSAVEPRDLSLSLVVWLLALALIGWSALGAAATAVVQADMAIIHAAVLSRRERRIAQTLAADYAGMVAEGERQVATRLTNLRISVTYLLFGALLTLATWALTQGGADPVTDLCPPVCRAED